MNRSRFCSRVALGLVMAALLGAGAARAQTQVKGRVMVLVDTSGSMVWHFGDTLTCGGEGDASARFSDINQVGRNYYPGNLLGGGTYDGPNSRLFAAKQALTNLVSASSVLDFGLMRYAPSGNCPATTGHCCPVTMGACVRSSDYVQNSGYITWAGGCGTLDSSQYSVDGGQILVQPSTSSAAPLLRWVDGVEDFRDGGSGLPLNAELRGSGPTPLSGAVRTATTKWYQPILNYSRANPNCNPSTDPLCDRQVDCRPYVLVMLTDGGDQCEGPLCKAGDPGCQCYGAGAGAVCYTAAMRNNPVSSVQALNALNPNNRVLTYVIGLAIVQGDPAVDILNNMAAAGGTGKARFANNQADIQAALADIAASTVRFELCNNKDDNCNNQVDEGFDKGAKCSRGVGACLRSGIKKCSANFQTTQCCVDDGDPTSACTPLPFGLPQKEICNGLDDDCNGLIDDGGVCMGSQCIAEVCDGKDNDCDGQVDNNPIDAGKPCGLSIGLCMPGTTACQGGKIVCLGGKQPGVEACNGCDDDCDGLTDGMTQQCYTGPPGTRDVGLCRGGVQACAATQCSPNGSPVWGACLGEVKPAAETCNGIDDDCNGKTDDVMGAGSACCPSGKCGVGRCAFGALECSGGAVQCIGAIGPTQEVCDDVDNDCNGKIDDVPGLGGPCQVAGSCGGALVCDTTQKKLVCKPMGTPMPELCDGLDNNCNGAIDEPAEVAKDDARVGKPCGNEANLPAPCAPGRTVCLSGQVVCQGAVGPATEVCDGKDNDCNGTADNGATCPPDFTCHAGGCYAKCQDSEFPCPGGYFCDKDKFCVLEKCNCIPCQEKCLGGVCVPACEGVTCGAKEKCECGRCVDDSCVSRMCPAGQRCVIVTRECVPDPCAGKTCGPSEFCAPTSGSCVGACLMVCGSGKRCVRGECEDDSCAERSCKAGEICNPATGACVPDPCYAMQCLLGFRCQGGKCVADPCGGVMCPIGTTCLVAPITNDLTCAATPAVVSKYEQVVGAGSGLSCSAAGGLAGRARPAGLAGFDGTARRSDGRGGGVGLALGLLVLGAITRSVGRRRRRRARDGAMKRAPGRER